jgi:hypothetical protein
MWEPEVSPTHQAVGPAAGNPNRGFRYVDLRVCRGLLPCRDDFTLPYD